MRKEIIKNLGGIECPSLEDIINDGSETRGILLAAGSFLEYAQLGKDYSVKSISKVRQVEHFPEKSIYAVGESEDDVFFGLREHNLNSMVRLSDESKYVIGGAAEDHISGLSYYPGGTVACTADGIFSIPKNEYIFTPEENGFLYSWGVRHLEDSLCTLGNKGFSLFFLKIKHGTISEERLVTPSITGNSMLPFDVFNSWNAEEDANSEILKTKVVSNLWDKFLYIDGKKISGELNEFGYISDIRTISVDLDKNTVRFLICENSHVHLAEVSISDGAMLKRKEVLSVANDYFTLKAEIIRSRAAENVILDCIKKSE